ncbi:MAG: glycoside hydrolase family 44 protein [Verrucomicrobiota bacterium]
MRFVLLFLLAVTGVQAQTENVYLDALGAGWENWSWNGSYYFTNTTPVYAGTASLKVSQIAWGGLSLHHASIASNAYAYLEFYINGGTSGGQLLTVQLEDDNSGTSSTGLNLENFLSGGGTVPAGSWKLVSIPLSAFAFARPNFTRIDVLDRSGTAQAAYYLDSISLRQAASTPPQITSVRAGGSRQVVAFFDTGITTPNASNFELLSSNDAHYSTRKKPIAATYTNNRSALTFTNDFLNGGRYTLYVNNVTNLTGTAIAPDTSGSFGFSNHVIQVSALVSNHTISPFIYGLAWAPSTNYLKDIGATVNRWGGNHTSTYNWQAGTKNLANDWYFENSAWSDGTATAFIAGNTGAGAQSLLTLPMLPYVAKDATSVSFSVAKYGPQQAVDPYNANAGSGVGTNGQNIVNNPLDSGRTNTVALQSQWLATLTTPPAFIAMDNEMDIWSGTHRDWHPVPVGYDEIWATFSNYATLVRQVLPNAKICGPVSCCWWFYWNPQAGDVDKAAHGGVDLLPWFLDRAYQHETQTSQRLLDVFDIHYYPDSFDGATDTASNAKRLRATRELWDPTYKSEGWIGTDLWATQTQPNRNYPQLIPRMKALLATHYPGLPLALTEYNWGADTTLNGALALADCLGIFGREDLAMACAWTAPDANSPAYQTFKLFRQFAGTSVSAVTTQANLFTAYAAKDPTNDALTVIVINKNPTYDYSAPIQLTGYIAGPTAQVWQVSAANLTTILNEPATTNTTFIFPAYSATLLRFTPADTDGDGMPDFWETTHGVTDANADPDGDNFTNLQEFLAGTDPQSATSALRLSSSLALITISNKSYQIEYTDNLATNTWSILTNNILGTGNTIQISDPSATNTLRRFYRAKLQ